MGTISERGAGEPGAGVKNQIGIDVADDAVDATADDRENDLPHQVERVITAVPLSTWLTLAGSSVLGSLALRLLGRRATASFIGQLTPTFLICGLYNKLTTVGAATALFSSRR